jgi:hypothetical protein
VGPWNGFLAVVRATKYLPAGLLGATARFAEANALTRSVRSRSQSGLQQS